jgi:hypothetical protein
MVELISLVDSAIVNVHVPNCSVASDFLKCNWNFLMEITSYFRNQGVIKKISYFILFYNTPLSIANNNRNDKMVIQKMKNEIFITSSFTRFIFFVVGE